MKERLSRSQRVEFLFGQIRRRVTADEAYAALEQYEKSFKEKGRREIGDTSEYNVMRALLVLPVVEGIRRSRRLSEEDVRGVDLTVSLIDDPLKSVGVQVKSSDEAVREFRDFGSQSGQYRLNGEEVLARRKLIVLNGRAPEDDIRENFLNGLEIVRQIQTSRIEVA